MLTNLKSKDMPERPTVNRHWINAALNKSDLSNSRYCKIFLSFCRKNPFGRRKKDLIILSQDEYKTQKGEAFMKKILLIDKFLLVEEKIFKFLNGGYTYPEFEAELKELLNKLGSDICSDVLNELDEKIYKEMSEQ